MRQIIASYFAQLPEPNFGKIFTLLFLAIYCSTSLGAPLPLWVSAKDGIYHTLVDDQTGTLSKLKKATPSDLRTSKWGFLTIHPEKPILYVAVNGPNKTGEIWAFAIQKKDDLSLINKITELPTGSAHIEISPAGDTLAVAYFGSAYTGLYSVLPDGSLGKTLLHKKHEGKSVNPEKQARPHPHGSVFSHDSKRVFVTDRGTDYLWYYDINKGKAKYSKKLKVPAGLGPRHIVFDPNYDFAYVSDELSAGVSVYRYDKKRRDLEPIQHLGPVDAAQSELWYNVSDLQVHPSGNFLYLINRGFDQITAYKINEKTGKLTFIENEPVRGSIARHSAITPNGKWLITGGTMSGNLVTFKINSNGSLNYTRTNVSIETPRSMVLGR